MPHDIENHRHSLLPSEPELKVKAIETALVNQGLIDPAALDEIIDTYQNKIGPKNGASIIAKVEHDNYIRDLVKENPDLEKYDLENIFQ